MASRKPPNPLRNSLSAFVTERYPFALASVLGTFDALTGTDVATVGAAMHKALPDALRAQFKPHAQPALETTPGVSSDVRVTQAINEVVDAVDGFFARTAIVAGLTNDERVEMLRGMLLTRAVDNRLKQFFLGGEVRYGNASFQGKGFRSLGQEAIYAAPLRFKRGEKWRGDEGWQGDVVAPLIRDLGAALAMRPTREAVRLVLSAQMGKAGPPMGGRDLHIGDFDWGVLPAAAPLSISTLTAAGMGFAFAQTNAERIAVSFIGEGGSSLGEWHEAINMCAARRLPVIFCLQNNQTALSTPVTDQSAVRVFADKASGYGMPGVTIDGTDPEAVMAAFTWAADRARSGAGPTLIELVAMRMCGHAHHDDMLYLGKEPSLGWDYPALTPQGYANAELYDFWSQRDPIALYSARLVALGLVTDADVTRLKQEVVQLVEDEAQAVIAAPWPDPAGVTSGVFKEDSVDRRRFEVLDPDVRRDRQPSPAPPAIEVAPPFDKKGTTFLEAVMLGVGDALKADNRTFVFGEDCGGQYGNAFLLLRPLLKEYGDRILNAPLAEGAVLGACVGAALAGMRPIGEIQFNDFVATGFNQLVNNAAKIRYRWGGDVPMVVRMPWGGLRHAGPYHSQNTESWFYRTPGLKIVCPSTPHDARALMASAVADPDPVLYYEHIALYRDPRIKQKLGDTPPAPLPIGRAALRRAGSDLAIVSYGAFVHVGMRVAERLSADGIEASVLDLRTIAPLDREAVLAVARQAGRVLILQEDSRTGGIGESLAAIVQEEAFEWLDAPVRIIGALDTPVPYSPPLEDVFLPSEAEIERAARLLVRY